MFKTILLHFEMSVTVLADWMILVLPVCSRWYAHRRHRPHRRLGLGLADVVDELNSTTRIRSERMSDTSGADAQCSPLVLLQTLKLTLTLTLILTLTLTLTLTVVIRVLE